MGILIGHHPEEERLDLTIEGNFDLRLSDDMQCVYGLIDDRLRLCVVDATRVSRLFDSGIGLMLLLLERLHAAKAALIVIGDLPGFESYSRSAAGEQRPLSDGYATTGLAVGDSVCVAEVPAAARSAARAHRRPRLVRSAGGGR